MYWLVDNSSSYVWRYRSVCYGHAKTKLFCTSSA